MRWRSVITVFLSLPLLTIVGVDGASAQKEPIKIGVVADISGPASSLGIPERNTATMLQEEIDAKGGIKGWPIKLVIYDGQSRETETRLAALRAIDEDKVAALVCCTQSGTSLAIVDAVQKAKIPTISMAASVKIVEPVKDRYWVFKTPQSDVLVGDVLIDYLLKAGIKKVAFMNVDNAFGDSGRVEFEKVARTKGLAIVASERFGDKDVDMTTQLTKVAGTDAQGVVVWAIPPAASIVTKNYRELGLKIPLFQSHGVANKAFIQLAGPAAANGVKFPAGKLLLAEQLPESDPQKSVLLAYARSYEAKHGSRNTFGGHGWDAIKLALGAIERALGQVSPDNLPAFRAAIRDELEKVREFTGISGIFNLNAQDHNGLDRRALTMYEIAGGEWKLAK